MSVNKEELAKFKFNELVSMIRAFVRVKKGATEDFWREGDKFIAINELETLNDPINDELIRRIKTQWSFTAITDNIKKYHVNLPPAIANLFNITINDLNQLILKTPPAIGAIEADGVESIFAESNNERFVMLPDGKIRIDRTRST